MNCKKHQNIIIGIRVYIYNEERQHRRDVIVKRVARPTWGSATVPKEDKISRVKVHLKAETKHNR